MMSSGGESPSYGILVLGDGAAGHRVLGYPYATCAKRERVGRGGVGCRAGMAQGCLTEKGEEEEEEEEEGEEDGSLTLAQHSATNSWTQVPSLCW